MSNDKSHLHPDLHDASLEKACKMAVRLVDLSAGTKIRATSIAATGFGDDSCGAEEDIKDLHYMLEYLRLNFDLVPKK